MLVFFIILISFCLLILITYFSTIKIEIDTLKIEKSKKFRINDFKINICLFLGKIKWFKISISKEKLEKSKNEKLKKLIEKFSDLNFINTLKDNKLLKNKNMVFKTVKDTKITLETLNLEATIGLDNIIVLTYLVAILDILLSIRLAKSAQIIKKEQYKYIIIPHKTERFYFNLFLHCVISVKISNIIKKLISATSHY